MSINTNRRNFLKKGGLLCATTIAAGSFPLKIHYAATKNFELQLGLASYTTRSFSLDETILIANRLELKNISIKDTFHLPINSSVEELKAGSRKIIDAGLNFYGGGVFYMKKPEDVNRVFNYAKITGIGTIIGATTPDLLSLVNEKIKEYGIIVAIHNHGPEDKIFPTPESVYSVIKNFDPRFGLCIDLGHTQRCGVDPAIDILRYADRIFDLHLKDVTSSTADGKEIEIGRGVINIPEVIRALKEINYKYIASFEFEKDKNNLLPGLAESVGYVRGILASQ